ncbi:pseudouridylate synthase TRUB2, mitochondrial isoform X2 [Equus przewalskii]|uniref:Pseudouridylate synthase TRUB2, mitochondrial isoform X2 n=1 Tax=Equus przewalskii TaxID=9798 RepID=A0ABM4MJH6_EQUPR
MGPGGLARLHGLFAAYKPPGLKWKHLRDTVELQLLKGLNAGKPPAPEQRVRFLLGPVEGSEEKELTLTAASVPTLTDHPLDSMVRNPRVQPAPALGSVRLHPWNEVTTWPRPILGAASFIEERDPVCFFPVCGPTFTSLKVGVGHRLDAQASGVLVLGVGRGRRLLTDMYNAHLTKDYTVRGLLGKATDDFCEDGRLVEKTTYDHVTREKLDRILALIQGSHQKALVMYSSLDLQTQEAYEMAVRGLIRPTDKSPMLITGIRCLHFAPPEFLLGPFLPPAWRAKHQGETRLQQRDSLLTRQLCEEARTDDSHTYALNLALTLNSGQQQQQRQQKRQQQHASSSSACPWVLSPCQQRQQQLPMPAACLTAHGSCPHAILFSK